MTDLGAQYIHNYTNMNKAEGDYTILYGGTDTDCPYSQPKRADRVGHQQESHQT